MDDDTTTDDQTTISWPKYHYRVRVLGTERLNRYFIEWKPVKPYAEKMEAEGHTVIIERTPIHWEYFDPAHPQVPTGYTYDRTTRTLIPTAES